jgi:AcrR family transcriptional regulator
VSLTGAVSGAQHPRAAESLRARRSRQLREAIYDAALELFAERSYDEVTVEEICERAGVGRATFFRSYGSKAGLLVELNARLGRSIAERLWAMPGESAVAQLWAVQDEVTRAWVDAAPALRTMVLEYLSTTTAANLTEPAEPAGTGALAAVAEVVRKGQVAGELSDLHDPDLVAGIILTSLAAVTVAWIGNDGGTPLETMTRNTLVLLLDGLAQGR